MDSAGLTSPPFPSWVTIHYHNLPGNREESEDTDRMEITLLTHTGQNAVRHRPKSIDLEKNCDEWVDARGSGGLHLWVLVLPFLVAYLEVLCL